jgi:hypothetical protein
MSAINLYRHLRELLPDAPVITADVVTDLGDGMARVRTTGAGHVVVRNPLGKPEGSSVFVRGDEIIGDAPGMPYALIEI